MPGEVLECDGIDIMMGGLENRKVEVTDSVEKGMVRGVIVGARGEGCHIVPMKGVGKAGGKGVDLVGGALDGSYALREVGGAARMTDLVDGVYERGRRGLISV